MNTYFPLFLNMKGKEVVVFGGGVIATRRVKALIDYGADVRVIAPQISEELKEMKKSGVSLKWEQREYRRSEIERPFCVIAATSKKEINALIYRECRHKEVLVNNASDAGCCDFFFPGIVSDGEITVGVTANGRNHKRAAQVTAEIRAMLKCAAEDRKE